MRKYRGSLLGLMIIGICSLMMLSFGVDMLNPKNQRQVAATINGDEEISLNDYYARQQQMTQTLRQQLGENFDRFKDSFNIEQEALDSLVSERLLTSFINSLGLTVSIAKIEAQISAHPFFSAGFSKETYQRFLAATGMNSTKLEETTRQELTREQLFQVLKDLGRPSKKENQLAFTKDRTKAKFRYAEVSPKSFESEVNTNDAAKLQQYFTENAEEYRVPSKVRYSFVTFKPADFESKVNITTDDLETEFSGRKSEFEEPKRLRIRKMFFDITKEKKSADAADALLGKNTKDKKKSEELKPKDVKLLQAQEAQERLEKGEDFVKVAKEMSDDEEGQTAGEVSEWMPISDLEPATKKAVANLGAGQISDVIETEKGFYLAKVEEVKQSRQKSLEEVKGEIEKSIRQQEAPLYTALEAESFLQKYRDAAGKSKITLESFAKENKLPFNTSEGLLDASQSPEGTEAELTARALRITPGDTDIVELTDDENSLRVAFVITVDELKESHIPDLKEVNEQVVVDFKKSEAQKLAKDFADKLLKQVLAQPKQTLTELNAVDGSSAGKIAVAETPVVGKNESWGGDAVTPELKSAAFALTEQQPIADKVYAAGDSFYLVELVEKKAPEGEDLTKQQEEFATAQANATANRLIYGLIETLRADAKLDINDEVLQLGRNSAEF